MQHGKVAQRQSRQSQWSSLLSVGLQKMLCYDTKGLSYSLQHVLLGGIALQPVSWPSTFSPTLQPSASDSLYLPHTGASSFLCESH